MPIASIRMAKGRTAEVKRSIARKITDVICGELKVDKESVTVLFDEYDREN